MLAQTCWSLFFSMATFVRKQTFILRNVLHSVCDLVTEIPDRKDGRRARCDLQLSASLHPRWGGPAELLSSRLEKLRQELFTSFIGVHASTIQGFVERMSEGGRRSEWISTLLPAEPQGYFLSLLFPSLPFISLCGSGASHSVSTWGWPG